MDLLCLAQIVPLPGRQTRGSLDTYAKLVILNGGTLLRFWNCVRYAVEPESRVFFALIYLYFGYEHGDTRNFNDTALEISNYRN